MRGHAIECRINAEHPQKFTPSAGKITAFNVPGGNGVRVDTAQYAEGVVPPYYDSLIAKLIVHGVDRAEAMARMERALESIRSAGNRHLDLTAPGNLCRTKISAPGSSTPSSWSAFWRRTSTEDALHLRRATIFSTIVSDPKATHDAPVLL